MTEFEEEFKALTSWDWINVDLIQQILTRFSNWHSDEEFQTKENELKRLRKINHLYKKAKKNAERLSVDRGERLNQAQDELASLESQLQQQALPVVKDFVAEWIEILKTKGLKPLKNPETYGETGFTEEKLQNIVFWISEHQEDYMRAWLDGYQVEKPQLFRLKLKNATISNYYLWLNQATGKVFVDKKFLDWTNHDNVKNIFTEQEIAKISDGAFVNNEAFELMPV